MGWANVISLNSFHVIVLGDPKLGWLATEHYQCVCGRVIFLESTKRRGQTLWLDWSRSDLPSGILSSIKCPPFVAVLVYLRLIQNLWIVQWNRSHHLLGFIKKIGFSHLDWDVFQEPLLKATITAFFPSGSSACAAAGRWLLAMMLSSCKAFRQRVPGWVSCYSSVEIWVIYQAPSSYIHTYIYVYIYMYIPYIYICVCMYTLCIYIYRYIYTHSLYIYTYTYYI